MDQAIADAIRLSDVYRLTLSGASPVAIANNLGVGIDIVVSDLEAIDQLRDQWGDPEMIRHSLALDLDSLYKKIQEDILVCHSERAKPEYYRQAREILLQKAMLFGLNSATINMNGRSTLWKVVQELKALDAPQLESEADDIQSLEFTALPASVPALTG